MSYFSLNSSDTYSFHWWYNGKVFFNAIPHESVTVELRWNCPRFLLFGLATQMIKLGNWDCFLQNLIYSLGLCFLNPWSGLLSWLGLPCLLVNEIKAKLWTIDYIFWCERGCLIMERFQLMVKTRSLVFFPPFPISLYIIKYFFFYWLHRLPFTSYCYLFVLFPSYVAP